MLFELLEKYRSVLCGFVMPVLRSMLRELGMWMLCGIRMLVLYMFSCYKCAGDVV